MRTWKLSITLILVNMLKVRLHIDSYKTADNLLAAPVGYPSARGKK
jgi:hypothetical protein